MKFFCPYETWIKLLKTFLSPYLGTVKNLTSHLLSLRAAFQSFIRDGDDRQDLQPRGAQLPDPGQAHATRGSRYQSLTLIFWVHLSSSLSALFSQTLSWRTSVADRNPNICKIPCPLRHHHRLTQTQMSRHTGQTPSLAFATREEAAVVVVVVVIDFKLHLWRTRAS